MDKHKIGIFKKDNPLDDFPAFSKLDKGSLLFIKESFAQRLRISSDLSFREMHDKLMKVTEIVSSHNADQEGFQLQNVFLEFSLRPLKSVYINWHHYDDVDEIVYSDLCQHFNSIWFPSVDDIDVFDKTFSWNLAITHYGHIGLRLING